MDVDIKLYLKPRPAHSKFGDRPWMLLNSSFPYGPFCSWQRIPPDATEMHTVHSPILAAALTKFHVEILPKLQKFHPEIPRIRAAATASAFSVVRWEGFDAVMQAQDFFAYCQYQPVKLMLGDEAPPPPTRSFTSTTHSPEFQKLLNDTLFPLRCDIELVDLDTDLQRLLWTSILLELLGNLKPLLELQDYFHSCFQKNPIGYVFGCIERYVLPHLDGWIGGGESFDDQSNLGCSTTSLLKNRKIKVD
ncbi:uncharacterized protein EV420DRAFT_310225 [Desarmillaria tabescens]|uniref:Uncharacterized protein n=1 Tax=Armillaria tabescens TaxID=1929756 RepID=A0AA39KDM7_ARMTA|nr:uncharacterized protein EV420DRAFT_310225 [Desarmillaria tabescens]KAK0459239.1 hypothetical protein EV420DRAFT_310225 [Desarmillaria tabescens]